MTSRLSPSHPSTGSAAPTAPAAPRRLARFARLGGVLLLALIVAGLAWLLYTRLGRPRLGPSSPRYWPVLASTMAGGGTPGHADGVVSAALFSDPFGVAVDGAGNTYVTDAGDSNSVRRIAPTGEVTTIAGGVEGWVDGLGTAARFATPSGIALAPDGSLVVADTGNNAIRRVSADGLVTTVAGGTGAGRDDGPAATAKFDGPLGVAVASDGTIVVADTYNDSIRRISADGTVTTVAGSFVTGYRDGIGAEARFDTPSGIAVAADGTLFVADTGNNLLRRIDRRGTVTTVANGVAPGSVPDESLGTGSTTSTTPPFALWRPIGVAVGPGGDLYVTDGLARVVVYPATGGDVQVIAGGSAGFADGRGADARFNGLAGIAVDRHGVVRVADGENYLVRGLTPVGVPRLPRDVFLSPLPLLSPAALGFAHVPWPVDPQEGWHEVTATLGEARGSVGGDGRERLHAGIDVHAEPGTPVRAVHDEKVTRPIAATGYGELNEMIHVGLVSYVHVKAGRDARDASVDPARFTVLYDENGAATRVRVRRGTWFHVGDAVGTANRFAHVHLGLGPHAAEVNLLRFSLAEFSDHVPPTIARNGVALFDEQGVRLPVRRGRVEVAGRVSIVVEAWDQVDRNERRRRLGVYSLGYQLLDGRGRPVHGFEEPRTTVQFDRLPQAPGAGRLAYAEGSGITVYGNKSTRFRYVVTNEVRGGEAQPGSWDTSSLAPGDYRLRVVAKDLAGNTTTRDVPVRVAATATAR